MEDPWADDDITSSPAQRFSSEDIWGARNGGGLPPAAFDATEESETNEEVERKTVEEKGNEKAAVSELKEEKEETTTRPADPPSTETEDDVEFGDLDDGFVAPAMPVDIGGGEDDFGDFGDFGDVDLDDQIGGGGGGGFVEEPMAVEEPGPSLKPLLLTPFPNSDDLLTQIQLLLSDLYSPSPVSLLSDEPIRQVEGVNQLLVTESSRDLYAQLTTPPAMKGLDWTRSRVRREHLISLGVPVNLDEVDSHRLHPLPPLRITTKPATKKPRRTSSAGAESSSGPSFRRAGQSTEKRGRKESGEKGEKGLGERPEWGREKSLRLLEYLPDQLNLVPPKYLARMQDDLVEACSKASALLAWLKQVEEVRTDDSKRQNDQIASLISQAQRIKTASSTSGGLFRKNSRQASGSGAISPAPGSASMMGRSASPASFGTR